MGRHYLYPHCLKAYALSALVPFLGCQDHNFNNPYDPSSPTYGNPSVTTDTTSAGGDNSGTNSSTKSLGTSTCLSGNCNPPSTSIYDFANVFPITPNGCSNVTGVRTFDTGQNLMHFLNANCGSRNQVYSLTTSYTGESATTPTNLTNSCNAGSTGVTDFTIDKGSSGYLLAYTCYINSTSYTTHMLPINSSGNPGNASLIATATSSGSYSLAWNPTVETYGFANLNQFQRYNQSGAAIAGPDSLGVQTQYNRFNFVVAGKWMLFNYGVINNSWTNYCSKIDSTGTLQCNGVDLSRKQVPIYGYTQKLLSYDNNLTATGFDPSTCSKISRSEEYGQLTNTPSNLFSSIVLNNSIGALSYNTNSSYGVNLRLDRITI